MRELLSTLLVALSTMVPVTDLKGNVRAALLKEEVKRSTVLVVMLNGCTTDCGDDNVVGRASGVMITPNGQIVTNRHAIEKDGRLVDTLKVVPTGEDERVAMQCIFDVDVAGSSNSHDIAFLEPRGEMPCAYSNYMLPRDFVSPTGTDIQIIGYPNVGNGLPTITVTNGQVGGKLYDSNDEIAYLKTDAKIISGVSGGAVIDDQGNFIGIATGRTYVTNKDGTRNESEEQIGLIIPSFNIWLALEELTGDLELRSAAPTSEEMFLSSISPRVWLAVQSAPLILAIALIALMFLRIRADRRVTPIQEEVIHL